MCLRGRVAMDNRGTQRAPTTDDRSRTAPRPRVLIGGVGYRWMGDASFGLVVGDQLAQMDLPPEVDVADLGYGAIYVAQDLGSTEPPYDRLILVVGMARERAPGEVTVERWQPAALDPADVQARIYEAGAGVIDVDHLLVIAQHFAALPAEVLVVEVEPIDMGSGDKMSPQATLLLPQVVEMVRQMALAAPGVQAETNERDKQPWSSLLL